MSPRLATVLVVARRVGIVVAFVLVLLRPGFGQADAPTQLADVDVLVVVDRTRSMAALDHEDRRARIQGAQEDLDDLAAALPGARFGMLTFGGAEARLTLPFTTDAAAFESAVETLYLEGPRDGVGSRADRPVPELTDVLERSEESDPDRRRIVVYVGDGEDTAPDSGEDESFDEIGELAAGGVVLGYGSTRGAKMPVSDDYDDDEGFVQDSQTFEDAVSRADLDNLREIADELGVPFEHRTEPGGMGEIAEQFESAYVEGEDGAVRPGQHDLTWLFGLLLLGLVLFELRAGWQAAWRSHDALLPPGVRGADR